MYKGAALRTAACAACPFGDLRPTGPALAGPAGQRAAGGKGHEAQKCETFVKIKPNLHGAEAGPSIFHNTLYFTVICARPGRRWPARPASGLPAGMGHEAQKCETFVKIKHNLHGAEAGCMISHKTFVLQ